MSDDSAVPHILLVDEKFHRLNRDLKSYRRPGSSKVKWEEKREEMRVHLEEFIEDIVPAANITNYSLNELPRGRLDRKTALLGAYRRGKFERLDGHGFQKFAAGRHIKSRLVCYWCVKTWLKKSRNVSDEDWEKRTTKSFLHVFGKSGETQSSNLSLNRQLYAVHPQRRSNDNGGSRCEGTSTVRQSGTPALAITVRDGGSLAPHHRILVHNVPDDRFYNPIHQELTTIEDHCLGDNAATFTNKFQNNYDGFVDLSTASNIRSLEQCLHVDTTRFQHADVVILEGLASRRSPTVDLMYLPMKFSGTHAFSFTDSIDPLSDGLGLFLFVKSNISHEVDPYFQHLPAPTLSEAISNGLGWSRLGKLYRFRPEMFHDRNEDGTTTSAIDLADWLSSSSVLQEIRNTNPHVELPTIRTTLRSISIYSLTERESSGFELHALKNQSTTSGHTDAYLFNLSGFRLGTTTGSLKLFSVDDDGRPIWVADLSEHDFSKGYIILKLPKNLEYSTRMELNLWASDGKFSNEASVKFKRNSPRKNHYAGQDGIEVLDDEAQTREMLNHHLQLKLSEPAYVGVSVQRVVNRFFIDSKPVYSEIVKELMAGKPQEFPLTSRESRLGRSLLGLDMLSFGRQNLEENSFGVRLRSMGLYRPVEDEERKKHWRADGEHIVQLGKTWNLLLTNKPLHAYGLSVNDERLIVTNHGTFFKSDETINELSSIPRESKPRFLHHIAPNPQSHLQFLVDLMDCDPAEGDSSQYENLVVSHLLRPTDGGRLLGQPSLGRNASRHHLQHISRTGQCIRDQTFLLSDTPG